jgi:L-Ala-D/L-Glu epimerase
MKLAWDRYTIHPRAPFSISRSTVTAYERVRVRVLAGDAEGWGEAAPNVYYHETADTVLGTLPRLAAAVANAPGPDSVDDVLALERACAESVPGDASARAAVSAALHDLQGKRVGHPVWQLHGLDPATAPLSSFTIAITHDEAGLRQRVEDARRYPILKIKLGSEHDEWIVRTMRRLEPRKIMRADANAAWTRDRALEMSGFLADHAFELVEQPLPPDDIEGLRALTKASPIPVIADESCRTSTDIPRLDGAVHGINIKLSKCGGLGEAVRMARDARARGMRVMLGCMVESTLGIAAAAHLASLAHYVDLDGAALLSDDPFAGVSIEDGVVRVSQAPGLGVTHRS